MSKIKSPHYAKVHAIHKISMTRLVIIEKANERVEMIRKRLGLLNRKEAQKT